MSKSKLEWAWLAGLFDGEGWISLGQQLSRRGQSGHGHWVLEIGISNTHAPTMKRVVEITGDIGGRLYPHHKRKPDGTRYQRACWKWHARSKKAESFLLSMKPYLVTKKEQADVALAAMSILRRTRTDRSRRGTPPLDPTDHQEMMWLKKQLGELHLKEYNSLDA